MVIIIKKILILVLLLITIFLYFYNKEVFSKETNKQYIIFIDPGHGGFDPGAVYDNVLEKNINLKIADLLFDKLTNSFFDVKITRTGDYDLVTDKKHKKRSDIYNRVKMINEINPDLTISIHMNMYPDSFYYGAQTFYTNVNEKSKEISEIFQNNLRINTNTTRVTKEINNIYLLNNIKCPSVLLELGFLSNQTERNLLIDEKYQNKIADILYISIVEYFK